MTPKITLSLVVSNAKELATMLEILNHHNTSDSDLAKQARAERDEALSLAAGWQRSAEQAQQRFIEATNQLEAMKEQLELAEGQVADTARNADTYRDERDRAERTVKRQAEMIRDHDQSRRQAQREYQLEIERLTGIATKAEADRRDAQREAQRATCHHPEFTVTAGQPICDTCGQIVQLAQQMRTDAEDAFNAWAKRMDPANDLHPDEDPRDHDAHTCERGAGCCDS